MQNTSIVRISGGGLRSSKLSARKIGFTLAEVLITLGIIGIVAAMTLPSVINKYKAKVFETGFKKSYANIQNAYIMTKASLGVSNIRAEYATYDEANRVYPRREEFLAAFYKELKVIKTIPEPKYIIYSGTRNTGIATAAPHVSKILPDRSGVGVIINSSNIYISVDTNGPYSGPNRLGFDTFVFYVDGKDKIVPLKSKSSDVCMEENDSDACTLTYPCSVKINKSSNGMGCAWYAINNISPDNDTKKYWDNLPK